MSVPDPGPAAGVDALIAEIAPGLRPPAVRRRDVVVVTGPWLAGVGAMTAALADRLPQWPVREAGDLAPGDVPLAVVFVVSAAAALTPSDCALLDTAAAHTDVVIGVVSKIDVHRQWPQMLAVAREVLAGHAARYRDVVWVGAAAAPERGTPRVDDVIAALAAALGTGDAHRRNRLRAWQCQLRADADRTDRDVRAEGRRARVQLVRERREQLVRRQRIVKAERVISLRSRFAQARVQLSQFADRRCAAVRGELTEDVTGMTRRRPAEFQTYVGDRMAEVAAEVDHAIGDQVAGIAGGLGLAEGSWSAGDRPPMRVADPGAPPLESRRLETQLMTVLGIGFGLGTALTLSRVLADLAPGLAAVGAAGCAVAGLAIGGWVVRIRGILRDRAVLERWVGEAAGVLRCELRDLVALRLVSAEAALSAELAARNEADAARVAGRVAELDRELREHAAAAARAAAVAERALPQLRRALERVGTELGESA